VKKEEVLVDTSSGGLDELGRITLEYQLSMESMEDIIYEDNKEIEKIYFDPFVKDKDIINKVFSFNYNFAFRMQIKFTIFLSRREKNLMRRLNKLMKGMKPFAL
jgi:hypothetical protein